MPMAISFPDTVSSATQFSDAASRPDAASSGKSQAISTGDECGACPAKRLRKSTEENFDAVLAWMVTGIVPQVQPPAVPESTDISLTSDSVGTDAAESTSAIGFGTATTQAGNTASQGIALASAGSQKVVHMSDNFTSSVPVGPGNLELPTTGAVTVDQSLNGAATPIRSQSVPVSSNQQSSESVELLQPEPSLFSSAVGSVAAIPEVQTPVVNLPVENYSDLPVMPEALSQDAIDALEQIGRLPGSVISQVPLSAFPGSTPIVSASQVHASSASTVPVAVSLVDAILLSAVPGSEFPISATLSSVQTESNEPKTPVPVSIQATSVLPAATLQPSGLAPSAPPVTGTPVMTPSAATAAAAALPVADAAVTRRSVTATSEKDAASNRKPSIVVTSDQALASNSKSRVQASSAAVASKNTESMNRPVRGRSSFDAVRSDMVQPNAANSLPDLARSISSEMRQPLSHQVSQAIMEHIEGNRVRSNDTLSVRLDPPELGEMTIELSKTLEGLAVRVTAREAVTMDMLFARGQEIESHLRGQHMNLKSLEFLRADMSGNQFSQGQQQNDASRRSENSMNQVRRGSRSSSPAVANVGRIATPDSAYGLSFRA